MQEAMDLTAALAAVQAVCSRAQTASDDELPADLSLIERVGRIVDAHRHGMSAEVEHRSRKRLGEESLAFRSGARDGVELVQRITRTDHRMAKRRIGLGAAIAPAIASDGASLTGRRPGVRAALEAGAIGVESARVIVNTVEEVRPRVGAEDLDVMVDALVESATTSDTEVLHEIAHHWAEAVDPDGPEPRRSSRPAAAGAGPRG